VKRLIFKCSFLQDVILTAHSASEGIPDTLDFIPGSNFLGIVAKHYSEFKKKKMNYDIFHSKKVKFGDAHIAYKDEKSFKAPLSWFINKGTDIEDNKWVHHALSQDLRQQLIKDNKQIKQVRKGWITHDKKCLNIETNFAIKSAYDKNKRTSKEGQLYGYKSISEGLEFIFYVDIDDSIDESLISNKLKGKHYIGRSRSAQYGKIKIELLLEKQFSSKSTQKLFNDKYLVIYAESRLIFLDDFGQMTLLPEAKHFNLSENWQIAWDLCQTKYQIYAPFNNKYHSYEADKVYFDKGSVFVFEQKEQKKDKINSNQQQTNYNQCNSNFDIKKIESGIGEYLNEGFGQVIVNPDFLDSDESAKSTFNVKVYESKPAKKSVLIEKDQSDESFLQWFKNAKKQEQTKKQIYESVLSFSENNKRKFDKITSSQWGQIRSIATCSSDFDSMMDKLFKKIEAGSDGQVRSENRTDAGFLEHGKIKDIWKAKKDILKNELENNKKYGTQYAVRLVAQMQKKAKNKEAKNE